MKKNKKNHDSSASFNSDIFAFGQSEHKPRVKNELNPENDISERDIFVGNEDFYKKLYKDTKKGKRHDEDTMDKRLLMIQKVLIAGIVTISIILFYGFGKYAWITYQISNAPPAQSTIISQHNLASLPVESELAELPKQTQKEKIEIPEYTLPQDQSLSLRTSHLLYEQNDYQKAYSVFSQLRQQLPSTKMNQGLKDYFQFMRALCLEKLEKIDEANRLYSQVILSESPVIRLAGCYHSSLIQLHQKQYLNAASHAYQTLCLVKAADFNKEWAQSLERNAYYIAAESISKKVLALSDTDKNIPDDLWIQATIEPPFLHLNEHELRRVLQYGRDHLVNASLTPQIQKIQDENKTPSTHENSLSDSIIAAQWSIACNGASIEELLSRFASNADLDIIWEIEKQKPSQQEKPVWSSRPVTLYTPAVSTRQLVKMAAGSVGLVGYISDRQEKLKIVVMNPAQYPSLQEHINLISDQALSLWQGYINTFYDDSRLPNAHLAIGLLQAQRQNIPKAISEYKLVANRFADSSLAPFALLNSSILKSNIQDYTGARKDLTQLIEQYEKSEIYIEAYLSLAEATMKDNLYGEAAGLYKKVYHSSSVSDFKNRAAFGAARCFYQIKDYSKVIKWLDLYITKIDHQENRNYHFACYLLGKSHMALGDPKSAYVAFQGALGKQLSKNEYGETVTALIEAKKQQQDFLGALSIIDSIKTWQVTQKDYVRIILLKSGILRSMGLAEKAEAMLGDRAKYIVNPDLKTKLSLELSHCYKEQGKNEQAYDNLLDTLAYAKPGPLAHQTLYLLAQTCLTLDKYSETISFCKQLLEHEPSKLLESKAHNLLATAYRHQKDYNKAAMFLLNQQLDDMPARDKTSEAYSLVPQAKKELQ